MKSPASSNLDLTRDEQVKVRAALQFLRARVGGWQPLSRVLHFNEETLAHAGKSKTISPTLAFRIARFVNVPVDDLLQGKFPAPGTCPCCGHVKEAIEEDKETNSDD